MVDWLAIERAAQRAWPALLTERYDGWVLRYARGYTRRANSITPLAASSLPLAHKVACCQRRYDQQGIEPVFRIIDRGRRRRSIPGWPRQAGTSAIPTLVLWRPLGLPSPRPGAHCRRWRGRSSHRRLIDAFASITGDGRDQGAHREIPLRVAAHSLRLTVQREGRRVGCALAVLCDGWLSLLDVAVAPWRRQGWARCCCGGPWRGAPRKAQPARRCR